MSVTEQIIQHLNQLSETEQNAVLDFVEYLTTRGRALQQEQKFSLSFGCPERPHFLPTFPE